MNRIVFVASLCVATALLAWAFSTRGKEGMHIFFLGSVLLLCTLAVGWLRLVTRKTPTTKKSAIFGAFAGLFLGGMVGAKSGFGRVMISIFNPELPVQDFGASFGGMGGGILGAFVLALLFGNLQLLAAGRGSVVPSEDSQASGPGS